jgi:hypothetical protein
MLFGMLAGGGEAVVSVGSVSPGLYCALPDLFASARIFIFLSIVSLWSWLAGVFVYRFPDSPGTALCMTNN